MGLLLYLVFHVLSTLLEGVDPALEGNEAQAMWVWTISLGIAFLPTLLSALGESRAIAWVIFVLGIVSVLLGLLIAYQYGINASAGYIALTIAVFMLLPAVFALPHTLRWARGG